MYSKQQLKLSKVHIIIIIIMVQFLFSLKINGIFVYLN